MNLKQQLEELFNMEQQLDIPMKDGFHTTLTDEQISILKAPKGSYPAESVKPAVKTDDEFLFEKLEELREALKEKLNDHAVSVEIFINAKGISMNIRHKTPEDLKREGISMRNIKGDFII